MKFSKRNITALKKLIEKYRSITLNQIIKAWDGDKYYPGQATAQALTGFSGYNCSICKSASVTILSDSCGSCFWSVISGNCCCPCIQPKSYENIKSAQTPKQLLTAFRKRADYIEKQLNKYNL